MFLRSIESEEPKIRISALSCAVLSRHIFESIAQSFPPCLRSRNIPFKPLLQHQAVLAGAVEHRTVTADRIVCCRLVAFCERTIRRFGTASGCPRRYGCNDYRGAIVL